MACWTLTIRDGSRVERAQFEQLPEALDACERELAELQGHAGREPAQFFGRTIDASQQVAVRVELAGPTRLVPAVRAGVDLRGDGSTEAFTGRVRRSLIEQRRGESAIAALRRVLSER